MKLHAHFQWLGTLERQHFTSRTNLNSQRSTQMISFYPGPSRVYDEIPDYVKDAHHKGILSMNHRSPEFAALSKMTLSLLKQKLSIPEDYTIFFASSATECWEIIAQSLITRESIHIYNGAFGEKWYDYTHRLRPGARSVPFDREALLKAEELIYNSGEIICITQNETSLGTQVSNSIIAAIRKNNPHHLIAVDATSSMAGIRLDFNAADIWFASVQKCFGLPAGLAVMTVSPKGIEHLRRVNENLHYNSLTFMADMMAQWQTPCTPNVLGIYLLMRTLQNRNSIGEIHKKTKERADAWYSFFKNSKALKPLVHNPAVRSRTVIAVQADPDTLEKLRIAAVKNGFLLGEGYGPLKKNSFRIANFPALKKKEIAGLMKFLHPYI